MVSGGQRRQKPGSCLAKLPFDERGFSLLKTSPLSGLARENETDRVHP
jgi:hypothetical protein